jgi:hypothetical protein
MSELDFDLDALDLDSAEAKVQQQSIEEQAKESIGVVNDCGDSCTI